MGPSDTSAPKNKRLRDLPASAPRAADKLRLSVTQTLGTKWLLPRFQAWHPSLDIEMRQFKHDEDFSRDDIAQAMRKAGLG